MEDNRDAFAAHGTPTWGLNRFREFLLSEFICDIKALEGDGLTDAECDHVQECLAALIRHTRAHASGGSLETLAQQLGRLRDAYVAWNGPRGRDPNAIKHRKELYKKLATRRRKLSRNLGQMQLEISQRIDRQFFLGLWDAVGEISNRYPDEFTYLSRALRRLRHEL